MDIIQFLENARHDVRHPLEGIRDFLKQIPDKSIADSDRDVLIDATQALLDYQETMLRVASQKNFDPCSIVNQIMTLLRPKALCKKIALHFTGGVMPLLWGDVAKFSRILTELTVNAIKFTEKGVISLSLRGAESADSQYLLQFEVRDTGRGVEKITEGIGLSAIKQWMTELSGTLTIKSELGVGTSVIGVIPFSLSKIEPLPLIDLSAGKRRIAKTEVAAKEMLMQLAAHLDKEAHFFSDAVTQKNWVRLADYNHRLLGALRYCGAPRLEAAASALEKASTENREVLAKTLLKEIDEFCKNLQMLVELERY